jgi:hypothetical protein
VVQTLAQHLAHQPCHTEPRGSEHGPQAGLVGSNTPLQLGMGWQHAARQQGHDHCAVPVDVVVDRLRCGTCKHHTGMHGSRSCEAWLKDRV